MKNILTFITISLLFSATLLAQENTRPSPVLPKFYMGVCTHFAQYKGYIDANLQLIKDGGFNSIRDDIYWGNSEIQKGKYDFPPAYLEAPKKAKEYGLEQLSVLAYASKHYDNGAYPQKKESIEGFSNFAAAAVEKLKGTATLFQVWNEWDGGCGMAKFRGTSTPEGYAQLLESSYKKIKEKNPEAIVVLNSICKGNTEFENLLKNGVIKNCDVLSLHTYNHSESEKNRTPEAWYERMLKVEEIVKKYNDSKTMPMFITEMGFNNQTGKVGYSQDESANYATRLFLLARTFDWIKGIWWYDFQDDGIDESEVEDNFGLVTNDLTPKPSYTALKSIADIIKNADFKMRILTDNPNLWILKFDNGGKTVLAMWNNDKKTQIRTIFKSSTATSADLFLVGFPKINQKFGYRDFINRKDLEKDKIAFTLTQKPLIGEGNFDDIELVNTIEIPFDQTLYPTQTFQHFPNQLEIIKGENKPTPLELTSKNSTQIVQCKTFYKPDELVLEIKVNAQKPLFAKKLEDWKNSDSLIVGIAVNDPDSKRPYTSFAVLPIADDKVEIFSISKQFGQSIKRVSAEVAFENDNITYYVKIPARCLGIAAFEKNLILSMALSLNTFSSQDEKTTFRFGDGMDSWPLNLLKFKSIYFN